MDQGVFIPPPVPYVSIPAGESRTGASGSDPAQFAMGDHKHPRLTSATIVSLDGSGLATATFTRTFATMPSVDLTPITPGGTQPVALQVDSWVMSGSDYVGCVVKGYRGSVTLLNLGIITTGLNLNAFGGSASGVTVSVIALQNSTV